MAAYKSICFLIPLIFKTFISSSHAHTFQPHTFEVGGDDGWTLYPSENYNSWSGRLRFLINDTLHFNYDGKLDSVLVVNKSDYDGCNANNPITKLEGGDSVFKFNRSGPFYFITGNKSNCDQGQKLIVVVLALRHQSPPPSIATPPSMSPVSPPSTVGSPVSPPTTAVSPVLPPSMSPISPPSTVGSPEPSPYGSPILSPPAPSSPGAESADSPGVGSADSPTEGGSASPPGGGGGLPPSGGSSGANSTTPPPSAATPLVSGITIKSLVTVTFGLWWLV